MTCNDSPTILEGEIWVQHYANIECISIYDTNSGKISIRKRDGSTNIHYVWDNGAIVDEWIDGDYTVWVKIKTIFTGTTRFMQFYLCWELTEPAPVTCLHTFKLEDQFGNPLNGNVQIGTTSITVLGTGTITLEQGKSYTATAAYKEEPEQTRVFTACSTETFTFIILMPTGALSVDKPSYEQGEVVTVSWAGVNVDNPHIFVRDGTGALKKDYGPFMTSSGMFSYTLPETAFVGNWSVVLDYQGETVDSLTFEVIEKVCPIPTLTGVIIS